MVKSSSASLNSQKMLYFRLLLMEMGEASIKKKREKAPQVYHNKFTCIRKYAGLPEQ